MKLTNIFCHSITAYRLVRHEAFRVGPNEPQLRRNLPLILFFLCLLWSGCWTHCYAPHIRYVWNLDQLGYAGLWAKKAGKRDRGAHMWEGLKQDLVDCGSLWFSPRPSLGCLCLPPATCPQRLFTKQEAKTPGWNNNVWKPLCVNIVLLSQNWLGSPQDTSSKIYDLIKYFNGNWNQGKEQLKP